MTNPLAIRPVGAFRSDGTLMDLAAPSVHEIDFEAMAAGLSKIARYNGTPTGPAFSVAQHSVMGAEALLNEGADELTAALYLLHDGHEYLFGDWTRPAQQTIAAVMREDSQEAANLFMAALSRIKAAWDHVIYLEAGLPAPETWTNAQRKAVHGMDERMLTAEVLALFGSAAAKSLSKPCGPPPKTRGAITAWPAMKAEERFGKMLERFCLASRPVSA